MESLSSPYGVSKNELLLPLTVRGPVSITVWSSLSSTPPPPSPGEKRCFAERYSMSYHDHDQHDLFCSLQEEIANVRSRMEFIVVASNDRQKELESTWSTVKNLDESVQSLTVQIKQRRSEIEALLSEDDPKNLSRRVKVTPVHVVISLNRLNESFVIKIKKKKRNMELFKKGSKRRVWSSKIGSRTISQRKWKTWRAVEFLGKRG